MYETQTKKSNSAKLSKLNPVFVLILDCTSTSCYVDRSVAFDPIYHDMWIDQWHSIQYIMLCGSISGIGHIMLCGSISGIRSNISCYVDRSVAFDPIYHVMWIDQWHSTQYIIYVTTFLQSNKFIK